MARSAKCVIAAEGRLHELMRLRDFSGIARPNPDGPPPG